MSTVESVWVPSDGSEAARAAVPIARTLARLERAPVHVVEAPDGREEPEGVIVHEAKGDPARAILDATERASVIVTSTRDSHDPPEVGLGIEARTLLARSACPIVLVRPELGEASWSPEEILVPHDGTPATSAALCPAAEIATRIGARLFALHIAADGAGRTSEPGSLRAPQYVDQPQHEWPEWAGEFVERFRSMCPVDPSKVRFFLAHGEPASEIVRIAKENEVDLVVLAWHGTLEPRHALVFKALLRSSPCPMMVVRAAP